jgi:hypothetical protein
MTSSYDESDHERAFNAYRDCGSLYQAADMTGIAYNTIRRWSKDYACPCPHHNYDAKILLAADNDQIHLILGNWNLADIEARLPASELPVFRTWLRIFATAVFFTTGDVPAILRKDVNGELLTAADIRKRTQTLRKPSYKESIESLRAAIEEVRAILIRNGIDTQKPGVKPSPLAGVNPTTMMIAQQAILHLPNQVDRDACCELFDALYNAAGVGTSIRSY